MLTNGTAIATIGCDYPNTTEGMCSTILMGSGRATLGTFYEATTLTTPPPMPSNVEALGLKGNISITAGQKKLSAMSNGCSGDHKAESSPSKLSLSTASSSSSSSSSSSGMAAAVTPVQEIFKVLITIGAAVAFGAGVVL